MDKEWLNKELNLTDYTFKSDLKQMQNREFWNGCTKRSEDNIINFTRTNLVKYGLVQINPRDKEQVSQLLMTETMLYWTFIAKVLGGTYNPHIINDCSDIFKQDVMTQFMKCMCIRKV